ncbi:hypothetical protein BC628DRAFT_1340936 [Trametes gibbosa]|nr:hypothetical protein BC628DRAFT_1340936 [Trametes gibbosa]
MSGRSVAYIGAPPPHLRKRKQRSLSPVVPDPEELVHTRGLEPVFAPEKKSVHEGRDAFGPTPTRSARVLKTYAHKRARSYASSGAEEEIDEDGVERDWPHRSNKYASAVHEDVHGKPSQSQQYRPRRQLPMIAMHLRVRVLARRTSALDRQSAGSSRVPPKRKRGRPPGKGRSIAELGPVILPYGNAGSGSSPTRGAMTGQSVVNSAAAGQSASGGAAVSALPVKRGPGRPRKHPLPSATISAPGGPPSSRLSGSSVFGKKAKIIQRGGHEDGDEDSAEADAVAKQLLQDYPRTSSPSKDKYAFQSVDVSTVARALEKQAAREAAHPSATGHALAPPVTPGKRPRGRPRGSKNRTTLAREAEARTRHLASLSHAALVRTVDPPVASTSALQAVPDIAPGPIKRRPGRPRKSAPASMSMEYFEPLKDPDASTSPARPSTPGPRRRGRSLTRRNSIAGPPGASGPGTAFTSTPNFAVSMTRAPAAPPTPPPFYLDLNTMQWRRRARSASAPPVRRRRRRSSVAAAAAFIEAGAADGEVTEYQSCTELCAALKEVLFNTEPKMAQGSVVAASPGKGKGKRRKKKQERVTETEDGLKIAVSGVLLVAGENEDEDAEVGTDVTPGTCIFRGSWAVLGDPTVTLDDGLVLKKLHEVVRGIDAYVTRLEEADFSRTADVPTRTMTVTPRSSTQAEEVPQCAGEIVVSVAESQAATSFGSIAKALRMTVVVVH